MKKHKTGHSAKQISLPDKDWILAEHMQLKFGYRYISKLFEITLHAYARQKHIRLRIEVKKSE